MRNSFVAVSISYATVAVAAARGGVEQGRLTAGSTRYWRMSSPLVGAPAALLSTPS